MSKNRLDDLMNLSSVWRWSRVPVLRQQSVAEHSFNVAAIALEICRGLKLGPIDEYRVIKWAILHDGPEGETGDVVYTTKRELPDGVMEGVERKLCPWYEECQPLPTVREIIKIADKIEEVFFLREWGAASERTLSAQRMAENLIWDRTIAARERYGWEIDAVVTKILRSSLPPMDGVTGVTGLAGQQKGQPGQPPQGPVPQALP